MTEGIVRTMLSYKEPRDKNLLWLRPYLHREGYELLYFGSKGWVPLIECDCNKSTDEDSTVEEPEPCGCK